MRERSPARDTSFFARIVAGVLLAAACSGTPERQALPPVGCYAPIIGPYGWAADSLASPGLHPAWIRLNSGRAERGEGYALGVPEGFRFRVTTTGAWTPLGRDSVLVQWASNHPGVSFRLAVEPGRLRGTGRFAGGDSAWTVVADRIRCPGE